MRLWKQLIIGLVAAAAGVLLWGRFVPGAGDMLKAAGLPEQLVAAIAPQGATGGEGRGRPRGTFGGPSLVVTRPVEMALVNDRLSAIGDGEAIRTVIVTPYSTGNLVEVVVKSGDRVEQGQVIARLDSDEQRIAADQARLTRDRAADKVKRYEGLRTSSAVTPVQVEDAQAELRAAELALQNAELTLSRRAILAPYGGIVGIISVNPGDYVTTSSAIARIDDRSKILVDFWVPERFVGVIDTGAPIIATAIARPGETFTGSIQAVDNRIEQESRTLRVRAEIDNPKDILRAGMSFQVGMRFEGDRYPSVDPLALQWSAEGAFVWRVRAGKAERVPVRIIQRNPDKVLVNAELVSADEIVIEGLQRLRDGGDVQIVGSDNQPAPAVAEGT
ncbi:efflux RND transporter periplasmic adaptor subunit [Rhizobium sp. TRM95111]|uniref:efflux RND transporter periplasmic adaptor subunit n=1 Tax=Rhizobium alarense TaxID=2846851 RepID=UPI001F43D074|nr:efflux RND transporter periplasmic adaptor subunit [Rhizobium alarense]MCF3640975.1 efflux RND transporter periplasmic adaptor subunit [Rhizobium alarense]